MTKKLYYTDSKIYEWHTTIIKIEEHDELFHIYLEETAFYPEGGGQPSDEGTIGGIEVVQVLKKDEEVIHILKEKPKEQNVFCQINRDTRIDYTQHHSAQHLLSAICLNLLHAKTVSFHLSKESATIDLDIPNLDEKQLTIIERAVNQEIYANHKLNVFYIDMADASQYNLIKVPDGHDKLRIVEIENIEYNACGGTHVSRTSEIGLIKLLKTEKMKGNTRLSFICGFRLLNDYSQKINTVKALSNQLTTSEETLVNQIEKIIAQGKEDAKKYDTLFQQYAESIVKKLINENQEDWIIVDLELHIKDLQKLSKMLLKEPEKLLILASLYENKVLVTHNGNIPLHCGQFTKELTAISNGKGGGSQTSAQATFENSMNLYAFLEHAKNKLQEKDPL